MIDYDEEIKRHSSTVTDAEMGIHEKRQKDKLYVEQDVHSKHARRKPPVEAKSERQRVRDELLESEPSPRLAQTFRRDYGQSANSRDELDFSPAEASRNIQRHVVATNTSSRIFASQYDKTFYDDESHGADIPQSESSYEPRTREKKKKRSSSRSESDHTSRSRVHTLLDGFTCGTSCDPPIILKFTSSSENAPLAAFTVLNGDRDEFMKVDTRNIKKIQMDRGGKHMVLTIPRSPSHSEGRAWIHFKHHEEVRWFLHLLQEISPDIQENIIE